jgi:hypothetical protein
MFASDTHTLDALAACLRAGLPLDDALLRLETAGGGASRWVKRVRPFVRPGETVEKALAGAGTIDEGEQALLAPATTPDAVAGLLEAISARRRRRARLLRSVLGGLLGPFAVAAITVVLNPLPALLFGSIGEYVGSVVLGFLVLGVVTGLIAVGLPVLLQSPKAGPRTLGLLARIPLVDLLVGRHAEAELLTIVGPYTGGPEAAPAAMAAAAAVLDWARLGRAARATTAEEPAGALVRLAPHLSQATNLAVVEGVAGGKLPARLAARGEEIDAALTKNVRLVARIVAYTLVVVLSLGAYVDLVGRALPGGNIPLLEGMPSGEQKDLDELMRELEGKPSPPPSKKAPKKD